MSTTENSMFPLPKKHWYSHQGVKQCMSCSSTFPKTLFGTPKTNCLKCGRVVCKSCLQYKIQDIRVCMECHNQHNTPQQISNPNNRPQVQIHQPSANDTYPYPPPNARALPIQSRDLYAEYEQRRQNPYLSQDSLKTYEEQFNLNLPQQPPAPSRSYSAASTVAVPHSLLDLTTAVSMPSNNAPTSSIPSPFYDPHESRNNLKGLAEYAHEDKEEKAPSILKSSSTSITPKRKSFRARAMDHAQPHSRKQSASVGNIHDSVPSQWSHMHAANTSQTSNVSQSRKSINSIPWIEDEDSFELDENAIKSFEDLTYTRSKIKCTEAMMIRLDGFGFGMFTANMHKPFDKRLHSALVMTACDLLKKFEPYTVFVQSDEIILMYPTTHHKSKGSYLFGGKTAKILSIVSSFASIRFIHHLQQEQWSENAVLEKNIRNCFASFNGKCFNVSDNSDMFDYVLWRLRANITGYHKKILTEDTAFCHGTFVKKEKYMNNTAKKERERITTCCVQIETKESKYLKLLVDKYWKNEFLDTQSKLKIPQKANANKLSFDDEDVFPDIYNTVLIHDGNTLRRKVPSLTQQNKILRHAQQPQKVVVPTKRKSAPVTRDVYSIARQFSALSKEDMNSKPTRVTKAPQKMKKVSNQSKAKQTQKKEKKQTKEVKVSAPQKVEKKKPKQMKQEQIEPIEKKQSNEAEEITPENNPIYNYDGKHMYETMIIHMDPTTNTPQMSKAKPKQKKFFKPKKKAYHRPPSMAKVGYKSKSPQPPQPAKPLPRLRVSKSPQPPRRRSSKSKSKSTSPHEHAISPSARQIIKPAADNPNYQYNYKIQLDDVKIKTTEEVEVKKDETTKQMTASARIRYINQRLQKIKQ